MLSFSNRSSSCCDGVKPDISLRGHFFSLLEEWILSLQAEMIYEVNFRVNVPKNFHQVNYRMIRNPMRISLPILLLFKIS